MLELKILPYPINGFKITDPDDKSSMFPDIPEGIPRPVSSIHGRIKTLLFVIPNGWTGPLRYNYLNLFYELVKKMDTVESFIVFHYEDEFYTTIDNKAKVIPFSSNRIHPIKVNKEKLSIWAQDLFYPIHYFNEDTLKKEICLVTGNNGKSYKTHINNILQKNIVNRTIHASPFSNEVSCKDSELPFEGGNILVGDQFILIGKDHENKNPNISYQNWFGEHKKIIFISNSYPIPKNNSFETSDGFINKLPSVVNSNQPLVHIDLFITLAGYNEKGQYTLVVGDPILAEHLPTSMDTPKKELLNNWITEMSLVINSSIKKLKENFPLPIKIIRNPLVLTYADYVEAQKPLIRKWFWASYNNCLVEVYKNKKTGNFSKKVWLPSYGGLRANYTDHVMPYDSRQEKAQLSKIPITNVKYGNWADLSFFDKKNKKIWKKLGFKVTLLKNNYLPLIADRGALNCITNCIDRI